jgi:hypothetical protein
MLKISLAFALLAATPIAAYAHGTPPAAAHGGQVAEDSSENWVELVIKGDRLDVYVLDEAKAPVPSAKLTGKATVLVGGKSQSVTLVPGDANSLTGKLDPAATGKVTAVLSLSVGGKSTQARIAVQQ